MVLKIANYEDFVFHATCYEPIHIVRKFPDNMYSVSASMLVFRIKFSFPFFAAGLEECSVGLCSQYDLT